MEKGKIVCAFALFKERRKFPSRISCVWRKNEIKIFLPLIFIFYNTAVSILKIEKTLKIWLEGDRKRAIG